MGRPRKNRVGEYAAALAEEFSHHLARDLAKTVEASQEEQRREFLALREEVAKLEAQVRALEKRVRQGRARPKVGKWVPGGPGRPPKDAAERIAAFKARQADSD